MTSWLHFGRSAILLAIGCCLSQGRYLAGVGIFDITGPASETSSGIHFRLWSRAFMFADSNSGNRIVFVSADLCCTTQAVKVTVVKRLQELFGEDLYKDENVLISSTHTHSGPGGYEWGVLYNIDTKGFVNQSFEAIVDGIVSSIRAAHNSMSSEEVELTLPQILLSSGNLTKSNINRSPASYQLNPDYLRDDYEHNTEHLMTLLRIETSEGKEMGMINWFSVHGVSMFQTNNLISGDNKGRASMLFESWKNPGVLPGTHFYSLLPFSDKLTSIKGRGSFVAAFSQTNEGDSSPNTRGPMCPDGTPCDPIQSTCADGGDCLGRGPSPTNDDFESTDIIGNLQFQFAQGLYENRKASIPLSGPVESRHSWMNFTNIVVKPPYLPPGVQSGSTCRPAMGYSFPAGTTDGAGPAWMQRWFHQGINDTDAELWWMNLVRNIISKPTQEQIDCQAPKPILLDVGASWPTDHSPWMAEIMSVQIFRIGQLFILAVPGEFTTMAGRLLRKTVKDTLIDAGIDDPIVRYEGACTIFGPHSLGAYQQEFSKMARALASGVPVDPGTPPQDLTDEQLSFLPPVIADEAPLGKSFGDVEEDVLDTYVVGSTAKVVFWGANLRNDLMTGKTFLSVEMKVDNNWTLVADDSCWETKLNWERHDVAQSKVTVTWDIPSSVAVPSTFRMRHFGYNKPVAGGVKPYSGTSSEFTVAGTGQQL